MPSRLSSSVDRRVFLRMGLGGTAWACCPFPRPVEGLDLSARDAAVATPIRAVVREAVLFAGIRKPIRKRAELEPRIES